MFSKFFIFAIVGLLTFTPAAEACLSTPEQRRENFDALDADKDGFLTSREYFSNVVHPIITIDEMQERFAEVDADKDGKLSFHEFNAMKQKQRC